MTNPILRSPVGTFIQPYNPAHPPASGIARVTQPFIPGKHDGIDINFGPGIAGHPLYAMGPGTVEFAGRQPPPDNAIDVQIRHVGYVTLQGHMRLEIVARGQKVAVNQKIGEIGNTGNSTGPHVHAEVWIGGRPIDWWPYLDQNQPKTCHPKPLNGSRIHTAASMPSPVFASTRLADNSIRTPAGVNIGSMTTGRPYGGTVPGGKWVLPDGRTGYGWVRIKFGTTWYFIAESLAVVS